MGYSSIQYLPFLFIPSLEKKKKKTTYIFIALFFKKKN